ncbi:MAG: thiamine-phosphate kinase [Actinomycetota bacterium]
MTSRGEFQRLADLGRHLAGSSPAVPVGVGDDAAVVRVGAQDVVVCVDVIVDGVHFRTDLSSPADVGWKAVAVNVSDLAAMGAIPQAAVVGLQRSPELTEEAIDQLYAGMAEAGREWGVAIVGGDTVTAPVWSVSLTAIGRPAAASITRGGARPGDRLVLVGPLGAAAAALWADGEGLPVPDDLLAAHRRPRALPSSGVALARGGATAMIDLSDGLGADAGHVARASGVDLRIDRTAVMAAVPSTVVDLLPEDLLARVALGGGEDFALLAAVPADRVDACEAALTETAEAPWRWIGTVEPPADPSTPAVWLDTPAGISAGPPERIDTWGYDHG